MHIIYYEYIIYHDMHIIYTQESVGARQMDSGAQWGKGGGLMRECKVQKILNFEKLNFK